MMLEQIERKQELLQEPWRTIVAKTVGIKLTPELWNRLRRVQQANGPRTTRNTLKTLALEAISLGIAALEEKYGVALR
jgi:hypothetical protein